MDKTTVVNGLLAKMRSAFSSESDFQDFAQTAWLHILSQGVLDRWDASQGPFYMRTWLSWEYRGYRRSAKRRGWWEERFADEVRQEAVRPEPMEASADLALVARRHPDGFDYVMETAGEVTSETTFRRIPDPGTARAVRDLFAIERRIGAGEVFANDALPRREVRPAYRPRKKVRRGSYKKAA